MVSGIRQIGDSVLHKFTAHLDWQNINHREAVASQLAIMRRGLYEYGGVGIAANQCAEIAEPLQIIIIGTNDEIARAAAAERYPNQEIPHETVMINPEILHFSDETYYPVTGEGCLSVLGALRGRVRRHKSIEMQYQNEDGQQIKRIFRDFAAHVVQHECDHLHGVTFMQKLIDDMSTDQKNQLKRSVFAILDKDAAQTSTPDNQPIRVLAFERQGDQLIIDAEKLAIGLATMSKETLQGLLSVLG